MDVQHVNRVWLSAVASVWTNDAERCLRVVSDIGNNKKYREMISGRGTLMPAVCQCILMAA
ncbi:hypothetical protein C7379_11949 [Hallella colorans]|uniref:Uncharacterized protein n=1 Tax=Hallella colorans TaxID=1703337 RepID=A0A2U0U1G4_9BACT|nr:hypothetical protein C7379_11949 [Hallella colorans]